MADLGWGVVGLMGGIYEMGMWDWGGGLMFFLSFLGLSLRTLVLFVR